MQDAAVVGVQPQPELPVQAFLLFLSEQSADSVVLAHSPSVDSATYLHCVVPEIVFSSQAVWFVFYFAEHTLPVSPEHFAAFHWQEVFAVQVASGVNFAQASSAQLEYIIKEMNNKRILKFFIFFPLFSRFFYIIIYPFLTTVFLCYITLYYLYYHIRFISITRNNI